MSQPSQQSLPEDVRELQLQLNETRRQNQQLQERIADSSNSYGTQAEEAPPTDPPAKGTGQSGTTLDKARCHVRKFTALYMLWCRSPVDMFSGTSTAEYSAVDRFKKNESKMQGQLVDFNEMFPPDVLPITRESWWASVFKGEATQQRSNMASRVRRAAGAAIFDCRESDLKSPETRHERFGTLIGLPSTRPGPQSQDNFDVEVLHEPYNGKMDIRTIFLNRTLMKTLNAILRGPLSIKNADGSLTTAPATGTVSAIWGVTHTTPGAIAMASVLTRWAASPDVELHEYGHESGIDWQAAFEGYLQYLTEGLLKEKPSVRELFRVWDETLFPNSTTGYGQHPNTAGGNQADVHNALDLLNAEEDGEPSDEL